MNYYPSSSFHCYLSSSISFFRSIFYAPMHSHAGRFTQPAFLIGVEPMLLVHCVVSLLMQVMPLRMTYQNVRIWKKKTKACVEDSASNILGLRNFLYAFIITTDYMSLSLESTYFFILCFLFLRHFGIIQRRSCLGQPGQSVR